MYVTVTTTSTSGTGCEAHAERFWPNEHLDTYLSRNETCRRFILGAVEQLK
jgi:hypothetical protein